jgi:hypothetical protein
MTKAQAKQNLDAAASANAAAARDATAARTELLALVDKAIRNKGHIHGIPADDVSALTAAHNKLAEADAAQQRALAHYQEAFNALNTAIVAEECTG